MNDIDRSIRAAQDYGVREDQPIWMADYDHRQVDYDEGLVHLSDPRLVQVDRIRLLTDPGCPFYDISYVWGTLKDGRHVRVDLGTHQLHKGAPGLKSQLVDLAREAGVFAKGLGMLDFDTISILH
jgi:hypothetical protein